MEEEEKKIVQKNHSYETVFIRFSFDCSLIDEIWLFNLIYEMKEEIDF